MATYAAFKHVELYNVGRTKKRVLRPPGGGSSDIFGADSATTPRTIRNHMASNIFGSTQEAPVKNHGDARRNGRDGDSYNRLFGGSERPYTPAKNHLKSNIPLGGDGSPAKTTNGNAVAATNGHSNGKAENNNANANGQHNGTSKTEIEASPKDPALGDSTQAQSVENEETKPTPVSDVSKNNTSNMNKNNNNNKIDQNENKNPSSKENSQTNPEENSETTPPIKPLEMPANIEETDNLSITANNNNNNNNNRGAIDTTNKTSQKHVFENGEINGNGPIGDGNHSNDGRNSDKSSSKDGETSSTTTSSVVSPVSGVSDCTNQSNKSTLSSASGSLLSPRALAGSRNPVTGVGIEMPLYKRTRVLRKDGNPVTGEGYNTVDASASVNGAKHVINKNRIPPGGYSSGLW